MFDIIAQPFGWLLMRLYEMVNNYGLAVILFALIVKIILLPFQAKSKRSMMKTSRLQPKLKELEKKHGANKQKYNEEVAKLYKEEKIHPMSGCLWSLLPFPIIIALFSAVNRPLTIMMGISQDLLNQGGAILEKLTQLNFTTTTSANYLQIAQAQFISDHFESFAGLSDKLRQIDYSFLGMNLGHTPQWNFLWTTSWNDSAIWLPGLLLFMLPIASGLLTYFSSKISMAMNTTADPQQQSTTKSMMLFMPLISVYFAFIMPGAIGIYIIASTLFSVIQDFYLTKRYTKIMEAEDAVKLEAQRIKDEELEAKRLETERKKLENKTEVNPNTSKKKQQKNERQEQLEKAAEWEKKHTPTTEETPDPAREGHRRFARGRAYDPARYNENETDAVEQPENTEETAEQAVYNPSEHSITFEKPDTHSEESESDETK